MKLGPVPAFILVALGSAAVLIPLTGTKKRAPASFSSKSVHASKHGSPIDFTFTLNGDVEPNMETGFTVEFIPKERCSQARVSVRGIDGVEVRGAASMIYPCVDGQPIAHTARVFVPAHGAGYVVASASIVTSEGPSISATQPFAVSAPGARHSVTPIGTTRSAEGSASGKVVVLSGEHVE
jgi:hypothetical protein